METLDNTLITANLYNRDFEQPSSHTTIIDSDCVELGRFPREDRVFVTLQLDETLHEWVFRQGKNYHRTINKLISSAMNNHH